MSVWDYFSDIINFKLKLNELENQKELAKQAQSAQQQMLQATTASYQQTAEVIKLTNALKILTILLVIIGAIQTAIAYFTLIKP